MMRALYPDLPAEELQPPKPTAFGRMMQRIRLDGASRSRGWTG